MNFHDLIQTRQSVRKYTSKPVEQEKLMQCLEAARLAPSASNSQPWSFIVVNENDLLQKVGKACQGPMRSFNNFVPTAPVILVMLIEKPKILTEMGGRIKKKEYPLIDIGIAAEHFCLQAAELGLGTCMLGWFNEKEIKLMLNIPENRTIGLLITLGYAPENYLQRRKVRKPMDKTVKWNGY
jgi:nitroreductase